ncbi:MAG: cytochrome c1 [Gammaproteobacteria bacterium]|nr:cytochrome c1 [Gammaproteobacteria bacterium]
MRRLILIFVMACMPVLSVAGGGNGHKLDPVSIDLEDKVSLQRGATIFVNYCLSCHSAAYMRYNRLAKDLKFSDDPKESEKFVAKNMLFAADKIGDLMKAAMPIEDAKDWFGVAPPDLTLLARYRGPDWIYTYLRSFYLDEKSPSGWNNTVFENVAMPHVLYEWQGTQKAYFTKNEEGVKVFDRFEMIKSGTKSPQDFDKDMRDLTNFFVYLGEPSQLKRQRVGWYVLLFLALFLVVTYFLKKEYWKDVH